MEQQYYDRLSAPAPPPVVVKKAMFFPTSFGMVGGVPLSDEVKTVGANGGVPFTHVCACEHTF